MSNKKSDVWNHFVEVDNNSKVKCAYCSQLVAVSKNSTGNLLRHLKKHPGISISRSKIVTYEGSEQSKDGKNIDRPTTSSATADISLSNTGVLPKNVREMESIRSYLIKPLASKKSKEIDQQLVAMITKEYHPFNIVEDPEFKKFVYLLCPSYQLPTRKTLTTSLIPAQYNIVRENVVERLKRAFAVCITVDGWTSRNNDGYYAMTAHYIVEDLQCTKLASDLIGCVSFTERHTAENIYNKVKNLLTEWNLINKITVVVSDNAANMIASIRLGGWRHWGCFAHGLNLVAQNGLKEIESVTKKIKLIVNYFRKSTHATAQLKATQEKMGLPVLKLKSDVPTRWNSTFFMIKRLVETKVALVSTLAILGDRFYTREGFGTESFPILSNQEWQIAEESIEVLEIFDIVTNVISAEKEVTASLIIIFYKQINKHLSSLIERAGLLPQVKSLSEKLQLLLKKRFDTIEDNELIAQCTILDPRYKKFGFQSESKYNKCLQSLYTKLSSVKISFQETKDETHRPENTNAPSSSSENITCKRREMLLWKDFDEEVKMYQSPTNALASAVVEVNKYIDEPLLPRNQDPLAWWHQRKNVYPRLYQLMKTRLCILATSVPCERIFSKGGQIITERRTRLDTKKVEEIMFLAFNLNNCN